MTNFTELAQILRLSTIFIFDIYWINLDGIMHTLICVRSKIGLIHKK